MFLSHNLMNLQSLRAKVATSTPATESCSAAGWLQNSFLFYLHSHFSQPLFARSVPGAQSQSSDSQSAGIALCTHPLPSLMGATGISGGEKSAPVLLELLLELLQRYVTANLLDFSLLIPILEIPLALFFLSQSGLEGFPQGLIVTGVSGRLFTKTSRCKRHIQIHYPPQNHFIICQNCSDIKIRVTYWHTANKDQVSGSTHSK